MVQCPDEQQEQNRIKLLQLKLAAVLLVVFFVALVAFGQVLANSFLTVAGLMCFTAAAALITYYMVLTQP
jgi:hypothetical protein